MRLTIQKKKVYSAHNQKLVLEYLDHATLVTFSGAIKVNWNQVLKDNMVMLMLVWSLCYQGGINHGQVPWGQQPYIAITTMCESGSQWKLNVRCKTVLSTARRASASNLASTIIKLTQSQNSKINLKKKKIAPSWREKHLSTLYTATKMEYRQNANYSSVR